MIPLPIQELKFYRAHVEHLKLLLLAYLIQLLRYYLANKKGLLNPFKIDYQEDGSSLDIFSKSSFHSSPSSNTDFFSFPIFLTV